MRKLTIAAALLTLGAAASARAQVPPPLGPAKGETTTQEALRIKDPVARDEAMIAVSNKRVNNMESEAPRPDSSRTFRAQIVVMNHGPKTIKSVSWSASLIDPDTGALIRTYDVTTKSRIAPGKTKELTKRLVIPRAQVVSASTPASRKSPIVADLKSTVTRVTYEDGTTSDMP